jgi:predicted enzyme related to lactoylglutathione lyase
MPAIMDLAAIVIDCQDPGPVAAFYEAIGGAEITQTFDDGVYVTMGGLFLIFRQVDGYMPPTWPSEEVPMQFHMDFEVDDLDQAEALLRKHGATRLELPPGQHADPARLRVMLDPAGHPFCIGTRL